MRVLASLAAASVLSLATSAQQAVFVGPGASIQAAIDAAAPGDTIYVAAGSYAAFTVNKAVQVIGEGSTTTTVTAPADCSGTTPPSPALSVIGIPLGSHALVSGMTIDVPVATGPFGTCLQVGDAAISVSNCPGTVALVDVVSTTEGMALDVNVVGHLLLERCTVLNRSFSSQSSYAACAATFTSCEVWAVDSSVISNWASQTSTVTRGIPGLRVFGSNVYLAGTRVFGGSASGGPFFCFSLGGGPGLDGGYGMFVSNGSVVRVVGGSRIEGGSASGTPNCLASGASAIVTQIGGRVDVAPGCPIVGGLDAPVGTTSAPPTAGIPPTPLSVVRPTLRVTSGATLDLQATGQASTTVFAYYSLAPGRIEVFPGIDGGVVLDKNATLFLTGIALNAGLGTAVLPAIPSPLPAALLGTTVYVQGLEVGAGFYLTNPVVLPLGP